MNELNYLQMIPTGSGNSISVQELATKTGEQPEIIFRAIMAARREGEEIFLDRQAWEQGELRFHRAATAADTELMVNHEKALLLGWQETLRPAVRHYSGYDLMTVTSYFDEG